jgi:hypothetical protein
MDKIKITINGKTFEAEGDNLIDILGNFLNESNPNDDLPNAYDDYYDYLSIEDFNPSKCSTPDQLKVLKERLQNRIDYTKKHIKDIDLSDVIHSLDNIDNDVQNLINKVDCIKQSYQEVRNYISNIKKINNEN